MKIIYTLILLLISITTIFGKNDTIYTSNKNDIRLQGYKDSLYLYNSNISVRKKLISLGYTKEPFPDWNESGELSDEVIITYIETGKRPNSERERYSQSSFDRIKPRKVRDHIYETLDFFPLNVNPLVGYQAFSDKIKPSGREYWGSDADGPWQNDGRLVYNYNLAKPKQAYIYRKPEVSKDTRQKQLYVKISVPVPKINWLKYLREIEELDNKFFRDKTTCCDKIIDIYEITYHPQEPIESDDKYYQISSFRRQIVKTPNGVNIYIRVDRGEDSIWVLVN